MGGFWLALAAVAFSLWQSSWWPAPQQNTTTITTKRSSSSSTAPHRTNGGKKSYSKKSHSKTNAANTTAPAQSAAATDDRVLPDKRPPLEALIDGSNNSITGDVQFLLDFAIVGHPKTATTTLLYWLRSQQHRRRRHPGGGGAILMPRREVRSLARGRPAALVRTLYGLEEEGASGGRRSSSTQKQDNSKNNSTTTTTKRGYKSPIDLETPRALESIRRYWPQTKLIVGLRHPVRWFESFYNFHLRHGDRMPPPSTLLGDCSGKESYNVCTDRSLFHIHLSYLGKTANASTSTTHSAAATEQQQQLLAHPRKQQRPVGMEALPNKVFLYEINQLNDMDQGRSDRFRWDLSQFLGLEHVLQPPSRAHVGSATPPAAVALDICQKRHARLRAELVRNGRAAAEWIVHHFLSGPDVTVSSPDRFVQLLQAWRTDPCDEK